MSNITVSVTVSSDFLEIAALDRAAWQSNHHAEFIPDGEHAWRIWCEHSVMYTARCEEEIVGAILAFQCENGVYCLHKVMVSQEYRGKGIAGLLFKALFNDLDAKKVDSFLTVDPLNKVALALYKKLGYRIKELVAGYYRSHEDRYLMLRKPAHNALTVNLNE